MSDLLRCTGTVKAVEHKSGASPQVDHQTGEMRQRPWAFDVIRVLIADLDFVEFTVFDGGDGKAPKFEVGQEVDVLVKVDQRKGRVQLDYSQQFPTGSAGLRKAS